MEAVPAAVRKAKADFQNGAQKGKEGSYAAGAAGCDSGPGGPGQCVWQDQGIFYWLGIVFF